MTDLEKFIDCYKQFGIDVMVNETDSGFKVLLNDSYGGTMKETSCIDFDGYGGFFSDIDFDENGKFKRQGFWE